MKELKSTTYRDVSIIIPVYNEDRTLGDIIDRLKGLSLEWEIIVIDDGSSDRSYEISKEKGVSVFRNPYNIGLGGCLKRGAREANGSILVFIDGDGQHPPEEIPKLLNDIDEYNMIVGTRNFSQQHYHRGFGNIILCWVAKLITGRVIPDLTTGFRCVRRKDYLEFAHILPNGFSSATTITLAMLEGGFFVKFVPVSGVKPRIAGSSKIKLLSDGIFFTKTIIRIIMMFSPLKVFLPMSLIIGGIGVSMGICDIVSENNLQESSVLMVILSAITFSFGVVADYLSNIRRDIAVRGNRNNNRDHHVTAVNREK